MTTYDKGEVVLQTPDGTIFTFDLEEDNARVEVE